MHILIVGWFLCVFLAAMAHAVTAGHREKGEPVGVPRVISYALLLSAFWLASQLGYATIGPAGLLVSALALLVSVSVTLGAVFSISENLFQPFFWGKTLTEL